MNDKDWQGRPGKGSVTHGNPRQARHDRDALVSTATAVE